LVIGGGTLIAAIQAARYARDAARETKQGAIEAKRSADAAEAALQLQRLPFLQCESALLEADREPGIYTAYSDIRIVLVMRNYGSGAARAARLEYAWGLQHPSRRPVEGAQVVKLGSVPPGAVIRRNIDIDDVSRTGIGPPSRPIYCIGKLTFESETGESLVSEFSYVASKSDFVFGEMRHADQAEQP
jgi:hypothetical protein